MAERLTDRGIAALKYAGNGTGSDYHFDSEVAGLAVRIYPTGRKVFVFDWRENGRQRRMTVGDFPAWTIGKARLHARACGSRPTSARSSTPQPRRPGRRPRREVAGDRQPHPAAAHGRQLRPAARQPHPARNSASWSRAASPATPSSSGTARSRSSAPGAANRALAVLSAFLCWLRARPPDRAQPVPRASSAGRRTRATCSSTPPRSRPPIQRSTPTVTAAPR